MKPNVLIVDDDPVMHLLYKRYLAEAGYGLLTAKNGREGMAIVSQNAPQLIVMDIMMPGGDGLSVLRELKNSEVGRNIPVIVVTANLESYTTATQESTNSGAASFLPKPLSPARLLAEVKRLLPPPAVKSNAQSGPLEPSRNTSSKPSLKIPWERNNDGTRARLESAPEESETSDRISSAQRGIFSNRISRARIQTPAPANDNRQPHCNSKSE